MELSNFGNQVNFVIRKGMSIWFLSGNEEASTFYNIYFLDLSGFGSLFCSKKVHLIPYLSLFAGNTEALIKTFCAPLPNLSPTSVDFVSTEPQQLLAAYTLSCASIIDLETGRTVLTFDFGDGICILHFMSLSVCMLISQTIEPIQSEKSREILCLPLTQKSQYLKVWQN